MLDIDPEEVHGLQDLVSALKSYRNRDKLTIKENPQNEFEWTLDDCIKKSPSFRVFCQEVRPDYLQQLLPLCIELDYYLKDTSTGNCLTFNIGKHEKADISHILIRIWEECFGKYTCIKWYYEYISKITNLANNSGAVRKTIERRR